MHVMRETDLVFVKACMQHNSSIHTYIATYIHTSTIVILLYYRMQFTSMYKMGRYSYSECDRMEKKKALTFSKHEDTNLPVCLPNSSFRPLVPDHI